MTLEIPRLFSNKCLLLWLLWSILWLVDLTERTKYDWLLQLSNYRCPITVDYLITLSNYNSTEWLVKNKADCSNLIWGNCNSCDYDNNYVCDWIVIAYKYRYISIFQKCCDLKTYMKHISVFSLNRDTFWGENKSCIYFIYVFKIAMFLKTGVYIY